MQSLNKRETVRMKRIVLGVVAILATAPWLLIGCQQGEATNAESKPAPPPADTVVVQPEAPQTALPSEGLRIAWVNMDSVLQAYDMYFDMQREMEQVTKSAEQSLASKGKALEKRVAEFQDNMQKGLITRSEAQRTQEELQKEQQRFIQLQEQQRQKVMEEEQVRLRKVQNAIQEFIKQYNQEKGYNYILSVGMLYSDPRLNITREVVDGLNAAYAKSRPAKTK